MTTKRFRVTFTAHRCRRCGCQIAKGEYAYRTYSRVYCESCVSEKPSEPAPDSRPSRRNRPSPLDAELPAGMQAKSAFHCDDGVWRYEFGSVGEAVADALGVTAVNDHNRRLIRDGLEEHGFWNGRGDRWTNRFNRERFLAQIADPSAELLEAVDAMRQVLIDEVDPPTSPRRRVRHGQEFGEELDADRVFNRIPEAWDCNVREPQNRRNVTIGCNLSVNCHIRPEQLLYRGAAALALADILTSRGFNVEIVCFDSRRDCSDTVDRSVVRYVVKDHLMPLDVNAVAFAMCEIAWFRIVGAYGSCRHFPGKVHDYLGSAASLPEAERKSVDFAIDSDVLSRDAAEAWLKRCMGQVEANPSESEAA